LILALGGILLLGALGVFPPGLADLLGRAWPVLLLIVGLTLLLDSIPRLRRWAPVVAVGLSVLVLIGVVATAYTTRANAERTENTVTFDHPVEESVQRLRVQIIGAFTLAEVSPTVADVAPAIHAEFTGSTASTITPTYEVGSDGTAVFTFEEGVPAGLPLLETMGRGRMRIELPTGVPIDLDFRNGGTSSLNLLGLDARQLTAQLVDGDLLLSLPNTGLENTGTVMVENGNLTVFVPDTLGLQVITGGKTPQFAEGEYLYDPSTGAYVSRRYDTFEEQTDLNLTVSGSIRLD
jgi:hypothetical protein